MSWIKSSTIDLIMFGEDDPSTDKEPTTLLTLEKIASENHLLYDFFKLSITVIFHFSVINVMDEF